MEDELKDRKKKNPCRLVESIRSGPESVRIPRDREYGVVLEGGGAKGAFQIGAWRALSEDFGGCGRGVKRGPYVYGRLRPGGKTVGHAWLLPDPWP